MKGQENHANLLSQVAWDGLGKEKIRKENFYSYKKLPQISPFLKMSVSLEKLFQVIIFGLCDCFICFSLITL